MTVTSILQLKATRNSVVVSPFIKHKYFCCEKAVQIAFSFFNGDLVQLVEHLVRNQKVAGSTPAISTRMSDGVIGNTTVSEAVIAGSSPARPTTKIIHL